MDATTIVEHVAELDRLSEDYESMNGNATQQQFIGARLIQQVRMVLPILKKLVTPLEVNRGMIIPFRAQHATVCLKCNLWIEVGGAAAYIGPRGSKDRGPYHHHCVRERVD